MDWLTVLLWLAAVLLVVAGIAGLLLPAIPGAPLILGGLVLAAWIEDFAFVGTGTLAFLAVLAILTYAADFLAGILGARHFGASPRAMMGAAIGAVVGVFFGLPGLLLGPFLGAAAGELSARRGMLAAGKAGIGATLGLVIGAAAKLALAFSMLAVFVARFIW
ncbi:MAG: hypothetical protein A2061_09830 [Gallionellales bacterium GWA2_59_43]|nr:MAG: hypothetical protein A2061_09830 [Gallionellales bacterium GWA2_59_43]